MFILIVTESYTGTFPRYSKVPGYNLVRIPALNNLYFSLAKLNMYLHKYLVYVNDGLQKQ